MSKFSLTNAEQLWVFFRYLEERDVDLAPFLEACHIPKRALTEPELKLTSYQIYAFIERVSKALSMPQLGWDVGRQNGTLAFGSLGLKIVQRGKKRAMTELTHEIQFHASGAHFFLLDTPEEWLFCNIGSIEAQSLGYAISEFYGVAVMIDLVRRSLKKPHYFPSRLTLRSKDWSLTPSPLKNKKIVFNHPYLSINFPLAWISSRRRKTSSPLQRNERLDFTQKLRQLLATHLPGPGPSLSEISQITGTPQRSIQRELAQEGTEYRKLLNDLKMELAGQQLLDSDLAVGTLASHFGYSHPSHFVRAFKRVHNTTPRKYRALQRS